MAYYLCPRRDKIRTSLCLSRSHPVMYTEFVRGWEQTPPDHLSPSKWICQWGNWNCSDTWRKSPSGRVLKINGLYMKLLNIILQNAYTVHKHFILLLSFSVLKQPVFVFVFIRNHIRPSSEKEVILNWVVLNAKSHHRYWSYYIAL